MEFLTNLISKNLRISSSDLFKVQGTEKYFVQISFNLLGVRTYLHQILLHVKFVEKGKAIGLCCFAFKQKTNKLYKFINWAFYVTYALNYVMIVMHIMWPRLPLPHSYPGAALVKMRINSPRELQEITDDIPSATH